MSSASNQDTQSPAHLPRNRREGEGFQSVLHNSGWPCREMVLHIDPVKPSMPGEDSLQHAAAGLREYLRIDRNRILEHFDPRGCQKLAGRTLSQKQILERLLLLSRAALGHSGSLEDLNESQGCSRTLEALQDEYIENVGKLDPLQLELPAFSLAMERPSELKPELCPARMLAVFSRTKHRLFIGNRSPVLPNCDPEDNPSFSLLLPRGSVPIRTPYDGSNPEINHD